MTRTAKPPATPDLVPRPERAAAPPDWERFGDRALLALLLRATTDPDRIAGKLLARFGSLAAAVSADPCELTRVAQGGSDAFLDLGVLRELAVRLARTEASRQPVIASWTALQAYARAALAHRQREQFRVLFLDNRNRLMVDEFVGDGTVDHAPVYPREVVRRALEVSASAMVLVHNHPSGDPTPSRADIEMTRKVVDAARVMGLQVHDHIVVGRDGTASFRALGLI